MYTDGSLLDNGKAGAGFVIPALKKERSFYIGEGHSVFTAELVAILMALRYIAGLPMTLFCILFCIDSRSVLSALQSSKSTTRCDLIAEILYLVHFISQIGTGITFCWVPAHCGIHSNEWADKVAKKGANQDRSSVDVTIPFSVKEGYSILEKSLFQITKVNYDGDDPAVRCKLNSFLNRESRVVSSLCYRLKLNALYCKHIDDVRCPCGERLLSKHILVHCPFTTEYLAKDLPSSRFSENDFSDIINDSALLLKIAKSLMNSPLGPFL